MNLILWRHAEAEEGDLEPIRNASLNTAMKLATADQFKLLEDLYNTKVTAEGKTTTVGKGFEKEFKIAKDVATTCGDKLDCYLDKLGDPASQKEETQFQGIKSAYMIGVLGKPEARAAMTAIHTRIRLRKLFEDQRLLFRRNTRPGIAHVEAQAAIRTRRHFDHDTARFSELHGVACKVE